MDERKVKTFALVSIASGLVGVSAVNYVRVMRQERKKRKEIAVKEAESIQVIRIASARVIERIRGGKYDYAIRKGNVIQVVQDDFAFEQIVEFNNKK